MVTGMPLDFEDIIPSNSFCPELPLSQSEHEAAQNEIKDLLRKKAIVPCKHDYPEFISGIFVVPKKDSDKMRVILSLKRFNSFLRKKSFKMETFQSMINLVFPGCWMTSVDLADAYLVVKILQEHTSFLKFKFDSVLYKYLVMCFGIHSAPRSFTKLLRVPLSELRSNGHIVSAYLDDSLQIAGSFQECVNTVVSTHNLFVDLGFLPNFKKSHYIPSQRIVILGFIIDSVDMTVALTHDKINKLSNMFTNVLLNPCMSIRELARIIGKMIACFPTLPRGRLYYRPLERLKNTALRGSGSYDGKVTLQSQQLECVQWWLANVPRAVAPIRRGNPQVTLLTDASGYAYGGYLNGIYCQGFFSEHEMPLSINSKETLAVWYSILSFRDKLIGKHLLVLSDNKTCISYVSKMGGMQSELRDKICRDIWNFVFNNNMWLSISFIPGRENWDADLASRQLNPLTELTLLQELFESVCMELEFFPSIDMMASRLNNKCKQYFSYCPDPFCVGVNVFCTAWSHTNMYIFSPFSLNSRVLAKIEVDGGTALIVAPAWEAQPWYSHLLCLAVKRKSPPTPFPPNHFLVDGKTENTSCPFKPKWKQFSTKETKN